MSEIDSWYSAREGYTACSMEEWIITLAALFTPLSTTQLPPMQYFTESNYCFATGFPVSVEYVLKTSEETSFNYFNYGVV